MRKVPLHIALRWLQYAKDAQTMARLPTFTILIFAQTATSL
jgi:hypothetical protein